MKKYKFNKLQKAWLNALETGKIGNVPYKKATKALCKLSLKGKPLGYCCLGVACEIYNIYSPKKYKLATEDLSRTRSYDDENGILPNLVVDSFKLHDETGSFVVDNNETNTQYGDLAEMNDKGKTHKQIAAFIRKHPHVVFTE